MILIIVNNNQLILGEVINAMLQLTERNQLIYFEINQVFDGVD